MAIEGKSVHGIAVALNEAGAQTKSKGLWHPLTVKRALTNRAYTGVTYYGQTKRVSKTKVVQQPETPLLDSIGVSHEFGQGVEQAAEAIPHLRPLLAGAFWISLGLSSSLLPYIRQSC